MDDRDVDEGLRAALRRNRLVVGICAAGLAVAAVALAVLTADGAGSWLGPLGILMLPVAGLHLLVADSRTLGGRRRPRLSSSPQPAVELRSSSASGVSAVLLGVGMLSIVLSFVVDGDLADSAQQYRGGPFLYALPVIGALLVLTGIALLVRPDRVLLTPEAVVVRHVLRERAIPWRRVRALEAVPRDPGLGLRIVGEEGRDVRVGTRRLDLTLWELRAVLAHHRDHPADRRDLGTPASLERVEALRASGTRPGPEPRWFAAPADPR